MKKCKILSTKLLMLTALAILGVWCFPAVGAEPPPRDMLAPTVYSTPPPPEQDMLASVAKAPWVVTYAPATFPVNAVYRSGSFTGVVCGPGGCRPVSVGATPFRGFFRDGPVRRVLRR